MEIISKSPKQTEEIGADFAKTLKPGDIIALYGDLGAGKTVFVKGIAQGLGIKKTITSPTFTLIKSYKTDSIIFHHIDLYRGENIKDLEALGFAEVFSPEAIVVLEWADRIKNSLTKKKIDVSIQTVNESTRKIIIKKSKFGAAQILKSGGVVIFPTDTVYGIGCRFDNKKAIDRIYQFKGTQKSQPFPTLVSRVDQVEKLAIINSRARQLMKKHWPGALTIILRSRNPNPAKTEKIGFRMPDSDLVRKLIDEVGVPIIGTSANFHTHPTPKSYEELDPKFTKLADLVIKGECQRGVESTVVDTTVSPIAILRQGAVHI